MRATRNILRERRQYNRWVGNQTLEDYALRFTSLKSRRWTIDRVGGTALGATAFMALEAIAAAITLQFGFVNAFWAMLTVSLVIFVTGLPIAYHAAKYGLDIDLLTRGAGFGYLGSTVTSLIYASFTFIFFAIEAAILASALHAMTGLPLALGYALSAVGVIPIVTHGISAISRFQIGTQGFWLLLQIAALVLVAAYEFDRLPEWSRYAPAATAPGAGFDLAMFGAAASILFALMAQIGEQVDYLRYLPEKRPGNRARWWFWLTLAGPGWVLIGLVKMLLGSFLAWLAFSRHGSFEQATDPTLMYQMAFNYLLDSPALSLLLAGAMVIVSQMKINVTNAYAGSIAWSNFFSRLTHNHPGRVVWLVFNVLIALLLMELGIYRALQSILGVFAIVAVSWLATLSADLMINRPLGLSRAGGEFRRAHLYDVNPVGAGSMIIASAAGLLAYLGYFGAVAASLAHFISLGLCFLLTPLIACLTRGRYYLAREPAASLAFAGDSGSPPPAESRCCICENQFELPDMSHCPAYQGPICSLCCSLDARCLDQCRPQARLASQVREALGQFLPARWVAAIDSRVGRFVAIFSGITALTAALFSLILFHMQPQEPAQQQLLQQAFWTLFFILMIVYGVIAWLLLLARESREAAQRESNRQTRRLYEEIEAHRVTDRSLQQAKELAERANSAKSRYLTGISHELRTPLQAVLGYAQLLSERRDLPADCEKGLRIIRRNGEYLTDLIEGLLDISTIEAGRLDIYRNRFQLPELLEQLAEMFRNQARSKGLGFSYRKAGYLPRFVYGDEKRLRQILINLLSNAVKYTERGKVSLEAHYRNQVAEFTVRDTGVGIEAKDLERVLAPFERVRDERVPSVPGTGLGLTIVHLLTEVMGGELQIESEPDRGSCFRVSLFLSRDDAPERSPVEERAIVGYHGRPRTLLVVDDAPIHRGLLADLLAPLGFIALEAQDGASCLELAAQNEPDLLLLDVSLPDMTGLELAARLRQRGVGVPLVMISADAREQHPGPEGCAPWDDYMAKPISNRLLLEKIGQLLDLQWRYADPAGETAARRPVPLPAAAVTGPGAGFGALPDHGLLRELRSYAQNGFVRGVRSTLAQITGTGLLSRTQLLVLEELAAGFRFEQMVQLLQQDTTHE